MTKKRKRRSHSGMGAWTWLYVKLPPIDWSRSDEGSAFHNPISQSRSTSGATFFSAIMSDQRRKAPFYVANRERRLYFRTSSPLRGVKRKRELQRRSKLKTRATGAPPMTGHVPASHITKSSCNRQEKEKNPTSYGCISPYSSQSQARFFC